MMFQPLDTQNFETSIGMISGVPASRTFSAVEAAALGLHYPIYNEDMSAVPGSLHPRPAFARRVTGRSGHPGAVRPGLHGGRAASDRRDDGGRRGVRRHPWQPFQNGENLQRAGSADRDPAEPDLSQATYVDDSQETTYNSLQTSVRQRMTTVQLHLNYTWSSTRANYDGDNTLSSVNDASQTVQDFFDLESSWGPVIGDVRHSFIGSVIYETPGADGLHRSPGISAAGRSRDLPGADRRAAHHHASVVKGRQPSGCHRCGKRDKQGLLRHQQQQHAVPEPGGLPAGADQRGVAPDDSGWQHRRWPVSHPGVQEPRRLSEQVIPGAVRRIELRADILNAFNWINYVAAQTNISASNFGRITGTGAARVAQLQGRLCSELLTEPTGFETSSARATEEE